MLQKGDCLVMKDQLLSIRLRARESRWGSSLQNRGEFSNNRDSWAPSPFVVGEGHFPHHTWQVRSE